MKKLIDGEKYDTETAKLCGYTQYGHPGDFEYEYQGLYQKTTGEFFLYGEGGPRSSYGVVIGQYNETAPGEDIFPLSYEEAQGWAKANLEVDEYESIFGEIEEDDTKRLIAITMPCDLAEKVMRQSVRMGKQISEIVCEALEKVLEE